VQKGVAYLSEDRKYDGLLLRLPIRQNISIAGLSRVSHGFLLDKRMETELTEPLKTEVRIVTPSLERLALNLSGGNQQKVAIAKWLFTQCDILIFDEPTRGIDVGARSEIYMLMNQLVDSGKSIILVSSDLTEILALSNIIVAMHEGAITGILENDGSVTQDRIMQQMLGGLGNVQS
jgi:ribose transport system ATP-binding protein